MQNIFVCVLILSSSASVATAFRSTNVWRRPRSCIALSSTNDEQAKISVPTATATFNDNGEEAPEVPSIQQLIDWSMGFHDELKEANGIISGFEQVAHWLDADFVQTGPDIGPLNLQDFQTSLGYYRDEGFNFGTAIPDLDVKFDGWHVDPNDPWRVWFVGRYQGTFNGKDLTLNGNVLAKANGQRIDGSPELYSYVFTPQGKMKWMTIGFVGDKYTGTNKGYGAFIGLLVGMGIPKTILDLIYPFVQAQAWFSQFQGPGSDGGTRAPRTRTPYDELPQWWKDRKESGKNFHL